MIYKASAENLELILNDIKQGLPVGIPTETVYGLAVNCFDELAVKRIFDLKNRPAQDPLIVHISSLDDLNKVALVNDQQAKQLVLLKGFWPGPLSIVLPKNNKLPSIVTGGNNSVAVRMPNHELTLELINRSETLLAAPSANISKAVSPTKASHVCDEFGDKVKVLDGGDCQVGLESTVLSLVDDVPTLLRPGAVTLEQLEEKLGEVKVKEAYLDSSEKQSAPGQQIVHYSPRTPMFFKDQVEHINYKRSGIINFKEDQSQKEFKEAITLSLSGNQEEIAKKLFASIREMDQKEVDNIIIDRCETNGIGRAIMDRLSRATAAFNSPLSDSAAES